MTSNILIYTTHKAASMFLFAFGKELSKLTGENFYSVNFPTSSQQYFDTETYDPDNVEKWNEKSGIIAPIRFFTKVPNFEKQRIIIHLRDPRDVLTSLYFSHSYSHKLSFSRSKGIPLYERIKSLFTPIDRFVLNHADEYVKRYKKYLEVLDLENVQLVTYEEMVLDFPKWLQKVIEHSRLDNPDELQKKLYETFKDEFKIDKENPYNHKRAIIPGDYKNKLKPATIEILNEKFQEILTRI